MPKQRGRKLQDFQSLATLLPEGTISTELASAGEGLKLPQLNQSPLLQLKVEDFKTDPKNRDLPEPIFVQAIEAEKGCQAIYDYLDQRLQQLADKIVKVEFSWRLRVGGLPGFRDLLLPAMHPVYGVPYIPASSIKGVVRAWAEQQDAEIQAQVKDMFGYLNMSSNASQEDSASIGKIQFLDAFPTAQCLSLDLANPQWHWDKDNVLYNPEPHALLSLNNVTLLIGIKVTGRGSQQDIATVEEWIRAAMKLGIGSRVSAGYGRARGELILTDTTSIHEFSLWSQGMYGINTNNPELRTVAMRGVLRYWFRAVALGLFDPQTVKTLESRLFGTLEPKAICGSLRVSLASVTSSGNDVMTVTGKIQLEANTALELHLAQSLLKLAFSLSGVGRGSRRPLHWNNNRLRGCHWELTELNLAMSTSDWQQLLTTVMDTMKSVQKSLPDCGSSSARIIQSDKRSQDVLNQRAHVYLIKCEGVKHPKAVKESEWRNIGAKYQVIGEGLQLLYSNPKYKGKSMGNPGNPNVGGAVTREDVSIPSYVLIKSIFPSEGKPYQVVTIFDVDGHSDRAAFADAVKVKGGIMVWPLPQQSRQ
jgi:CRISPR-associated protein Cmr6